MLNFIEHQRAHSAAGSFGGTVSGATNATPIVITTTAAHNLIDGDQVQGTGIGGNTAANALAFAKVLSPTTFGMYSDAGLTGGVAGTGNYTSGGAVSMAYDISGLSGDFTLRITVEGMAVGKKVLLAVQDSADGFVSDVKTLMVVNLTGSNAPESYNARAYQVPSLRLGVTNARLRLNVQSIDSGNPAVLSLGLEQ